MLLRASERTRSFRATAYRKAIWSLDDLSPNLEDPPERILAVPGLGRGMVRLIGEFKSQGVLEELVELEDRYPLQAGRLRRLPRMTPAMLRDLKSDVGVDTTADLVRAIETGDVSAVRGVGVVTAEKWLAVLEAWADDDAVPAFDAWVLSVELERHLARHLDADIRVGGEVRRVAEWAHALAFVVSGDLEHVRQFLRESVVGIPASVDEGGDRVTLETPSGLPMLVHIVDPGALGSALIESTGPNAHLVELGDFGKGSTEAEVYGSLGWPWVPPPAREGKGPPPKGMLEKSSIRGDLHVHSAASPDGRMSLETIVEEMVRRGLEYVAITDHTIGLRFGGLDEAGLRKQARDVAEIRAKYPGFTLLHGAEVNIDVDGNLDIGNTTLEMLDFVVAGVHSHFDLPRSTQTDRVVSALRHPVVRVLAHPTGRRIGIRPGLDLDLEAVVDAAVVNQVALEANGHRDRLDVSGDLARMAVSRGALFAANSDAHRVAELDNIENAVASLQRARITEDKVINALPAPDFGRWIGLTV